VDSARRVRRPIPVVPDKARSQKGRPVRDLAQRLGLELLDLPACSPRLNRMARLWKFVPKKCLYHRYYGDFAAFRQAIQALLRTLGRRHASALHTLLTWRFQTFREQEVRLAQFMAALGIAGGSAVLWMHFFWIFGHPEVYVLVVPAFAIASEIIPVFSRKVIFGYPVMGGATMAIGFSV
jgi:hypothetical protein